MSSKKGSRSSCWSSERRVKTKGDHHDPSRDLYGPYRSQPRRPARQLRVLSCDRHHPRTERGAQEPAAYDARPGDRRSGKLGRRGRERDKARRGRRADRGHPRHRPLGRRAGPRGDAGGAEGVPGPVPRGRRWLAMSLFQSLFPVHREAGTEILPSEGRLSTFEGATGWLNSEPLRPEGLRGRLVAVQFWTYTCVNWLRTLPYVREWAQKYHDQGLSVIGVHTPEFGFEQNVDNVIAAAKDMRVDYPIALDSNYAVWRAFANHFWPALYIADEQGRIRYHHFGEGEYAMSEMAVQQLLGEAGKEGFDPALVSVEPQGTEVAADWSNLRTPETYLS